MEFAFHADIWTRGRFLPIPRAVQIPQGHQHLRARIAVNALGDLPSLPLCEWLIFRVGVGQRRIHGLQSGHVKETAGKELYENGAKNAFPKIN